MATTTAAPSASDLQSTYMKLLVTQMQNQDPMSPMSNDQMTSQMTAFSQLEQLQNINTQLGQMSTLNSTFSKVLQNSQMNYAQSMVGKGVAYTDPTTGNLEMGTVDQVELDNSSGQLSLRIGQKSIGVDQVIAVGSQYGVTIPNDMTYANGLVNRTVNYYDPNSNSVKSGKVGGVDNSNGDIVLQVGNDVINLNQVTGIVQ